MLQMSMPEMSHLSEHDILLVVKIVANGCHEAIGHQYLLAPDDARRGSDRGRKFPVCSFDMANRHPVNLDGLLD